MKTYRPPLNVKRTCFWVILSKVLQWFIPQKELLSSAEEGKNLKVLHVSQNDGILWPNLCYYYFKIFKKQVSSYFGTTSVTQLIQTNQRYFKK